MDCHKDCYYYCYYDKDKHRNCFDLGDLALDFTLDGVFQGQQIKASPSQYRGKWLVLFFYGSNFTFV